jgi:hypothetical protein
MIPHSPMIDWLPWPDLRDLAIQFQEQIDLDALFRMAIHNVVAHRRTSRGGSLLSSLNKVDAHRDDAGHGTSTGKDYSTTSTEDNTSFRIWELVCLEKANGTEPLADPQLDKKAVVRSPGVRAVLRAYDLEYDDFATQKLDDDFFATFPSLYCESAASNWKVRSLDSLPARHDVGRPTDLTRDAVLKLKHRLESHVGTELLL